MRAYHFPEFLPPLEPCNLPVRRCPLPRESATRRFLIMRTGAHGDILMATPLLAALREAYPDAFLSYLVDRKEQKTIEAHPALDEIIVWDGMFWKRLLRRGNLPIWLYHALRMRRLLRERCFDVFISLQAEEWPLLTRNIGAATRIGVFDAFRLFAEDSSPSNARWFTHAFLRKDLPLHRTRQFLLPLQALGLPTPERCPMTIGFTAEDVRAAADFLHSVGLSETRFVVLAPTTTWPSRCWEPERFARLGDALSAEKRAILLIGAENERETLRQIAAQMNRQPAIAAGALHFRALAALLTRASLLISGDTGPMHLAAAVGTPYLALFGPTPAEGRAPLVGRGLPIAKAVPCSPCDQKTCRNTGAEFMQCLRSISVEEVFLAARRLLRESAPDGN